MKDKSELRLKRPRDVVLNQTFGLRLPQVLSGYGLVTLGVTNFKKGHSSLPKLHCEPIKVCIHKYIINTFQKVNKWQYDQSQSDTSIILMLITYPAQNYCDLPT